MTDNRNIFLKKKILIYGLGKSGLSSYKKTLLLFFKNLKVDKPLFPRP